jgi:hypothetical protein
MGDEIIFHRKTDIQISLLYCSYVSKTQGSVILAKGSTIIKIQLTAMIETSGGVNF